MHLPKPATHDFGLLEPNTIVWHTFEIHNQGDLPLELEAVAS